MNEDITKHVGKTLLNPVLMQGEVISTWVNNWFTASWRQIYLYFESYGFAYYWSFVTLTLKQEKYTISIWQLLELGKYFSNHDSRE